MAHKPVILFLCTGNACRSQMAEGWARALRGEAIEPCSAGTAPKGLDPLAVQVMAEAGLDISGHRSRHLDEFRDRPIDYVITVCDHAAESCPVFPGSVKRLHHGFADPPRLAQQATDAQQALDHYRRVRDQIRAFIETLPDSLPPLSEPDA